MEIMSNRKNTPVPNRYLEDTITRLEDIYKYLTTIDESTNTALKEVYVGFNMIKVIEPTHPFLKLKFLTLLDLQNNQLDEIPSEITGLVAMTTLDLRNNNLKNLPTSLGFMPTLSKVLLDGITLST